MGDLTNEYFARIAVIEAVKWVSKFQTIPPECDVFLTEQKEKIAKLKTRFSKLRKNVLWNT